MRAPPHHPADAPGGPGRPAPTTAPPHHTPRPAGRHPAGPGPARLHTRPSGPRCALVRDTAYIPTDEGRLHPATAIDIASRRVVGRATADHLRTDLVADALQAACRTRRPTRPVIFHSDRLNPPSTPAANSPSLQTSSTSGCRSTAPAGAGSRAAAPSPTASSPGASATSAAPRGPLLPHPSRTARPRTRRRGPGSRPPGGGGAVWSAAAGSRCPRGGSCVHLSSDRAVTRAAGCGPRPCSTSGLRHGPDAPRHLSHPVTRDESAGHSRSGRAKAAFGGRWPAGL
ncbi:DDE-type integrase/transposase/recombinase [Kitasatospora sp. NPDC054939]